MTLVIRCGHQGKVCAGSYLVGSPAEADFYAIDEGKYLLILPILQLVIAPIAFAIYTYYVMSALATAMLNIGQQFEKAFDGNAEDLEALMNK